MSLFYVELRTKSAPTYKGIGAFSDPLASSWLKIQNSIVEGDPYVDVPAQQGWVYLPGETIDGGENLYLFRAYEIVYFAGRAQFTQTKKPLAFPLETAFVTLSEPFGLSAEKIAELESAEETSVSEAWLKARFSKKTLKDINGVRFIQRLDPMGSIHEKLEALLGSPRHQEVLGGVGFHIAQQWVVKLEVPFSRTKLKIVAKSEIFQHKEEDLETTSARVSATVAAVIENMKQAGSWSEESTQLIEEQELADKPVVMVQDGQLITHTRRLRLEIPTRLWIQAEEEMFHPEIHFEVIPQAELQSFIPIDPSSSVPLPAELNELGTSRHINFTVDPDDIYVADISRWYI